MNFGLKCQKNRNGASKHVYCISKLFTKENKKVERKLLKNVNVFTMNESITQFLPWIFAMEKIVSMSQKKTIVTYYGVKRHRNELVDAMSGFGLKTPLRKAIVTKNIF